MVRNNHSAEGEEVFATPEVLGPASRARAVGRKARWQVFALFLLAGAGIVAARWLGAGEQVNALRGWIEGWGSLGPVVYGALYAIGVAVALPGSLMSLGAGALFGTGVGIVVVSLGATVGASLAFLVARYLARDAIAARFSHTETFQRLDRLTEERGAAIVALTRLIPLFPFNLLNYGFGLTSVRFGTYVFWSWLCMLPGIVVFVAGTDAVVQFVIRGQIPWAVLAAFGIGLAVLVGLVRFAYSRLEHAGRRVARDAFAKFPRQT
jgi:uncharacterized membrane protein YdjX (TVP38/TMEM64 family)